MNIVHLLFLLSHVIKGDNIVIMIAGGSGFLGYNVARCLADRGDSVLLVQRHPIQTPPLLESYWEREVRQAAGDITDLSVLLGLVKAYSVESIIHAAHATAGAPKGSKYEVPLHQMVQVQVQGTLNCLEAARLLDLRRVSFISSVDLYRGWPKQCDEWHEDAYLPPVSFSEIGNNKRAVEQLCFLYADTYGTSVVSLRVGGNYGPLCDWNPINTMIENAVAGKPSIFPEVRRSLRRHSVYAKDTGALTALIHMAESPKHYIYNVADGGNPTLAEFAQAIRKAIPGAEIQLGEPKYEEHEFSPVRMERVREEFGYTPYDIKQGVAAYIDFLKHGKY
jgi:nucleoside-diphosphate-sugar epimerase